MGYFKIGGSSGGGGSVDLTSIESAIISKGGTVTKEGQKATVNEIIHAIKEIPDRYGMPLKSVLVDNIDSPDLVITESYNIQFI
ncbi:hypothetical protein P9265_21155 [Schinkia azotoformans]|uniref:hypothetical protein n=1 Tax=Schinkia azotoformans TaxID=1454 RepID=UPI002E1B523A|nr:hypothetical protein [Schinkia azotoformans]